MVGIKPAPQATFYTGSIPVNCSVQQIHRRFETNDRGLDPAFSAIFPNSSKSILPTRANLTDLAKNEEREESKFFSLFRRFFDLEPANLSLPRKPAIFAGQRFIMPSAT